MLYFTELEIISIGNPMNNTGNTADEDECLAFGGDVTDFLTSEVYMKATALADFIISLYIILLSVTIIEKSSLKWYTVDMFTACFIYATANVLDGFTDLYYEDRERCEFFLVTNLRVLRKLPILLDSSENFRAKFQESIAETSLVNMPF